MSQIKNFVRVFCVISIFFYADFSRAGDFGKSLESLLPSMNDVLTTLNQQLKPLRETFVEGSFNIDPMVDLLRDKKFYNLIGWSYKEASDLVMHHVYNLYINIVRIHDEPGKSWETIRNNWKNLLKFLFPNFIKLNSIVIADDGSMYAMAKFFKDDQEFSKLDCDKIIEELKKLNVNVSCVIDEEFKIELLPGKNKKVEQKDKEEIIKLLNERKILGEKFAFRRYAIRQFTIDKNGIPQRTGGVELK